MGGEIDVGSSEGEGSTFTFSIPMKVDREDMSSPLQLPKGPRVHIVCDDEHRAEIRRRQIEKWGAEVMLSEPEEVEGSTADIYCIMSTCHFGRIIEERLIEHGVNKGRILVIGPGRSAECTKLGRDVSVLVEPVSRKKLHRALESAAAVEAGEDRRFSFSIPSSEREKGGPENGGGMDRSDELVSKMLRTFVDSALELLEAENCEEIEETALQVKQELERYGYGETKETLFKLVLAARKKKTAEIKKILEDLKAAGDSLTMGK
jgi:hypothetical protein